MVKVEADEEVGDMRASCLGWDKFAIKRQPYVYGC